MNDDFYIGWESKAAPGYAKAARKLAALLFYLAAAGAIALAVSQRLIGNSVFEWGAYKNFSGVLKTTPYPHLLVPRPGSATKEVQFSTYYLVAPWKFGLPRDSIAAFDGLTVSIKGALIYRDGQVMIETKPEWISATNLPRVAAAAEMAGAPAQSLGRQTLVGEIVDSKCFLGVMNPGRFAPHRACAIRCISGGCPPMFVIRQKSGPPICLLLVSTNGQPVNQQVLDLVAEPVEITGEVERQGNLLILKADPAACRRVTE